MKKQPGLEELGIKHRKIDVKVRLVSIRNFVTKIFQKIFHKKR